MRFALLAVLGASLGYASLKYGGVLSSDWRLSGGLIGAGALCWSLRPREFLTPARDRLVPASLFALLTLAAAQLPPLPLDLLRILSPNRAALTASLAPLASPHTAPLSVLPAATLDHLFRIAAYVLVFVLAGWLARSFKERPFLVVLPIVLVASAEAALGLIQVYGAGPGGFARGTFPNRNHFAGMLAMTLPFLLAWALACLRRRKSRFHSPAAPAFAASVLLSLATVLLVAVVHSLSRMGFLAALFGLAIAGTAAFSGGARRRWKLWVPVAAVAVSVVAFALLPTGALIARFGDLAATEDISADTRAQIWRDTFSLIRAYPLFGCGLGAYESALLQFKTAAPMFTVDYAHNDYLQIIAELGLPAALLLALIAGRLLIGTAAALRREDSNCLAAGCLGALAAILLHSFVDFNLYIPANALLLSWIAGISSSFDTRLP
ncbi:MAG: O-antigen ligase family protein [Acidobacteria bacterium]|nr:O-antigen ligase family protein [Acidobacteriota bacterium]